MYWDWRTLIRVGGSRLARTAVTCVALKAGQGRVDTLHKRVHLTTMEVRQLRETSSRHGARDAADDGLTIVEMMIALTIVMIVFAVLASTVIASFTAMRNTEARVRGVALANELVEEMATIQWLQLGLHEDDVPLDPDTGDPLQEFEDESIVSLIEAAEPIPTHEDEIERDGITYDVVRWITWAEEDDQPELKRMIAIVSWSVGGRDFTIRSDGLRSPDAGDIFDLEVSVEVEASNSYGSAMWLSTMPPEVHEHKNMDEFVVTATMGVVPADVELRFRERDGTLRVLTGATTPAGSPTVREWTIEEGGGAQGYHFQHGRNAFTVFATGDDGQVASDTATLRFYQRLDVLAPQVFQGGSPVDIDDALDLPIVEVDEDGQFCAPVTVEVDVEGMTAAEASPTPIDPDDPDVVEGGLTLDWDDNPDDPAVMEPLQTTVFGGRYVGEIVGIFLPDPLADITFTATIFADRLANFTEFEEDETDPFDVLVVEGC